MTLSQQDVSLFYKLWYKLVYYVNSKLNIVPNFPELLYPNDKVDRTEIYAIREELWEDPNLIDEYLKYNDHSCQLNEIECGILDSWRKFHINSNFAIMSHSKKYSVLMPCDENISKRAYGVLGITNPIFEVVPHKLPFIIKTVILPFKNQIIYDSFIASYNLSFGRGACESFRDEYREVKARYGIIESLPPTNLIKLFNFEKDKKVVPNSMKLRFDKISDIIVKFCKEKLNDEFCEIMIRSLAKLCRKRPSPVSSGSINVWACSIVYAIGSLNFIFDKSQMYYMSSKDLASWFGVSPKTAGQKSYKIIDMLHAYRFSPEFSISKIKDSFENIIRNTQL
jgi:hypothetical protein